MNFLESPLEGAFIVDPEANEDERGFFARVYGRDEFLRQGLDFSVSQCSLSHNSQKFTLRGMHYQLAPHAEAKLVRCTRGSIYDVILDLRRDSATFGEWAAVELSADGRSSLYVPAHFAHGFQTLANGTDVLYMMSANYDSESARGIRWNDPSFAITWPEVPSVMSNRDANFPEFTGK